MAFRLTANEYVALHKRARDEGLSPAAFARLQTLGERKVRNAASKGEGGVDPELWFQVRKLGVNLNQIARRLNELEHPYVPPDLDPLLADIRRLLNRKGPRP